MQTIVHALAVIGVAGLVALVLYVRKRLTSSTTTSPEVAPQSTATQIARQHTADTAKREHSAIRDALSSTDAAERLADIGNRRRDE